MDTARAVVETRATVERRRVNFMMSGFEGGGGKCFGGPYHDFAFGSPIYSLVRSSQYWGEAAGMQDWQPA